MTHSHLLEAMNTETATDGRTAEFLRRTITTRVAICVLSFLFVGCAGDKDASYRSPFQGIIGHTFALNQPMILTNRYGYLFGGNGPLSLRNVHYGLAGPGDYSSPHIFTHLPEGHLLTIDAVRDEMVGDDWETVVYGHTMFPSTEKETTFAYDYRGVGSLPWYATMTER